MITMEAAVEIYLDINLMIAIVALFWWALRPAINAFGLKLAFTSQLTVLKMLAAATVIIPVLYRGFVYASQKFAAVPANLSDVIVTQRVRGHIDINAIALEEVLYLRQNITSAIIAPESIWGQVFIYGIIACAAYLAVRVLLAILKVRNVFANSYEWRRFGRLQLRISDTTRVPFSTRTLWNHVIVFPSAILTDKRNMDVAMAHELQHLRQSDVSWEVATTFATPLFCWNPAFYFVRNQLNELRELSCDQQVLRRGRVTPQSYCESLLQVCASRFEKPALFELQEPRVTLVETRKMFLHRDPAEQLKKRIDAAFDIRWEKEPRWKSALIACLMLAICVGVSFVVGKPQDWTQDRLMLSTIVNLDRLEQRNTFGVQPY